MDRRPTVTGVFTRYRVTESGMVSDRRNGEYVLWEDYILLESEVERLTVLLRALAEGIDDYWQTLPENETVMVELRAILADGEGSGDG